MSVVMSAFPLASVLGVPCGLWLAGRFDWHAPFYLLAALSAAILVLALRVLPHVRSHLTTAHPWVQMRAILTHPVHLRGFLLSAALVFAGGCVVPFMAPSMVANVGLGEDQLFEIYLCGGMATFASSFLIGRLTDRYDKLHVLAVVSVVASVAVLGVTRLVPGSIALALGSTTLFFVGMSGRFAPAMAMMANAVEARYRGGFMSVNAAIQQIASGLGNLTAGLLVTTSATGHLVGYQNAGYLSLAAFIATMLFAWRLRAAAPHAARPGGIAKLAPEVATASLPE